MIDEILSRASKVAEAAEVFQVNTTETPVTFETNRLKQIMSRQSRSIALRLVRQGKLGFATASGKVKAADLVGRAAEVAEFGASAHFDFPGSYSTSGANVYSPNTEQTPQDTMVAIGQGLIDAVVRHTPELKCDARVVKGVVEINIANSRGSQAAYKKSIFHVEIEGTLIRGTDMLFVGDEDIAVQPAADYKRLAQTAIDDLENAKTNTTMPTGFLPAIFTPHGAASAFIAALSSAFSGRVVLQGASPLGHRKGEKVFDESVSLWDDSTIPLQPSSRPWDDEGTPAQKTPLIANGIVGSFLYDLQTAGIAKARSTGNGSRAMGGMPAPMATALVMSTGKASLEDMLRGMDEGLLIEQLMGAEQGNVLGGDFSGNVLLGFRVERGKIVGRVKDTMVAGNVYDLLRSGVVLGKDARWVYGHLSIPHIFVPRLSVSGKG
ncbi:MAG: TldD/PmbA family protein [Chloroflexi bacterium]|nr:TldD/PmbA family protein [Chloroflexota bacterium]